LTCLDFLLYQRNLPLRYVKMAFFNDYNKLKNRTIVYIEEYSNGLYIMSTKKYI
ncbi:MAG: hypothetical protein QG588_1640, partial [Candidatus Poribacteria bacterium]|nr:hypothetical protein [Candidatus Poribacteria bacterium]